MACLLYYCPSCQWSGVPLDRVMGRCPRCYGSLIRAFDEEGDHGDE